MAEWERKVRLSQDSCGFNLQTLWQQVGKGERDLIGRGEKGPKQVKAKGAEVKSGQLWFLFANPVATGRQGGRDLIR